MTQTFHRDSFTWLAYLFLGFYSYFLNGLGPATPFLMQELRLSYTVSSLHFSAFAVGILLVGLQGHRLIGRIGRWQAAWIGAFGITLSSLLLLAGRSPVITIGASFCMGLVGSLILAVVPSALSEQHGERRAVALAEANVIGSITATAAPLMVGLCARSPGGWRLAFGIVACAPIVMRLLLRRAGPSQLGSRHETQAPAGRPLPLLYWIYWAALTLAVSVEFCMIFWSADFVEKSLGLAKVDAAQAVSLFLAGMIIGRLAASRAVHRFATPRVVMASILVAGMGFTLFWTTGQALPALLGLFVAGLGVAGLYPLILSLAIGATEDADQASARATLASGTAILALPLVLGRLADLFGIRQAYTVVAVLLVGVFLIILLTGSRVLTRQAA